jgi:hypothetical protein
MTVLITDLNGFFFLCDNLLFFIKHYDLIIRSIERTNIYFEGLELEYDRR